MHSIVRSIADKVELLVLELRELNQAGPLIRIVHRFQEEGVGCHPGEEVFAAALICGGREYYMCLTPVLLMLLDYLGHHRHLPQSSSQIEAGMRSCAFYVHHGRNAQGSRKLTRHISKRAVKEYVKRLRRALALVLREAGTNIDAASVLLSEPTVTNQVGYRLRAQVEWVHHL